MATYLGADEQTPAPLFVRLVSPTDIQEVASAMEKLILGQTSWDWVNPTAWRLTGWEAGAVITWLERMMLVSKTLQVPLTRSSQEQFRSRLISEYGYTSSDLDYYFDAWHALADAGEIPDSIYRPWTYEPTTLAEDVAVAARKSVMPLVALTVLGIGAYAFFASGLPRMMTRTT